jgi:U4/U6.U5 tri-snRNP-associated protein 1
VGLASTLQLLKQKGLVEKVSEEQKEREVKQREKSAWLAEQKLKDMKRQTEKSKEKERAKERSGRGGRQDDYHYEEDQRREDRQRARELEEKFKNYNPDVELKYHDEYGRSLNAKEVNYMTVALCTL